MCLPSQGQEDHGFKGRSNNVWVAPDTDFDRADSIPNLGNNHLFIPSPAIMMR